MGQMVKAVAVYDELFWTHRGYAGGAIGYLEEFREFHDHCGENDTLPALFGFAPSERLHGARLECRALHLAPSRYRTRFFCRVRTRALPHPSPGRVHWASTEIKGVNIAALEQARLS